MLSGKETNEMCSCASHTPLPVAYDNTETVNIGYGSYSRKEVSTSVTKVDSKDVDNASLSNISDINPREVRSVEILKDGGAAIYGSRGANGVILITMKNAGN